MSSEFINYINSFIDEKHAFFHQEALDIYSVLVDNREEILLHYDNVIKSKEALYTKLSLTQNKYMDKIKEYLLLNNYNDEDVNSLINNLDSFYKRCVKHSESLTRRLVTLYSTTEEDNKIDIKLKMSNAIENEMKKNIGKLLEDERKMLQQILKLPQYSQQLPQTQLQLSRRLQLQLPQTQLSQRTRRLQLQLPQPQLQLSRRTRLLQPRPQLQLSQRTRLLQPQTLREQQLLIPQSPRLLHRPQDKHQTQDGEDIANLLQTHHFYKTKYNKTKDGSEEVRNFNITTVPHIKYIHDNDVIIDMIKGDLPINIETTNKYVYNFKEKKIINEMQDIGIFLNGSNLKSIKYFLKPRVSGPYLEITINIPFIILSDNDTDIYLTYTDILSNGTDFDLEDYIRSLIDIIKDYVRKQDPVSFL